VTVDHIGAVSIVAERVIAETLRSAVRDGLWGDYPEIGEHDWAVIEQRIERVANVFDPGPKRFEDAYAMVEAAADQGDRRE
jgi:hypothetical protein